MTRLGARHLFQRAIFYTNYVLLHHLTDGTSSWTPSPSSPAQAKGTGQVKNPELHRMFRANVPSHRSWYGETD